MINNNKKQNIYIFLVILAFTFAIRWPSFFPSSIDWDESTFLLIGEGVLKGHLPYTELWDVKPPLLFFVFTVINAIAGKSIIIVRIIASLFLATAAFFVYQIAKQLGTHISGFIAVALFLVMTGEVGGQAFMSELIAVVPLTSGFLLMIRQDNKCSSYSHFLLGFLLSLATLVRLNLAYLDLAIFLYYFCRLIFNYKKKNLINLFYWLAGLFIPIILVTIPYIVTNNLVVFYKSFIEASLSYSTSQIPRSEVTSHFLVEGFMKVNFILWIGLFGGLFLIIRRIFASPKVSDNYYRRNLVLLLFWLIAIGFSIASTGNIYAHYIIQILPFMTTVSGLCFSCAEKLIIIKPNNFLEISNFLKRLRFIAVGLFFVGWIDLLRPVFNENIVALKQIRNGVSLQDDEGYQVAQFLLKANPNKEPVYMMDFHIVHWLTDIELIDNIVAHPSTLGKDYLLQVIVDENATVESEMERILNKEPLFIIKPKKMLYLQSQPKAEDLLLSRLKSNYELVTKIKSLYIYKRLE